MATDSSEFEDFLFALWVGKQVHSKLSESKSLSLVPQRLCVPLLCYQGFDVFCCEALVRL